MLKGFFLGSKAEPRGDKTLRMKIQEKWLKFCSLLLCVKNVSEIGIFNEWKVHYFSKRNSKKWFTFICRLKIPLTLKE
jgi:hypothetical protein